MRNRFPQKKSTRPKFLCYNSIMLKTKTKVRVCFVGILSIAAGIHAGSIVATQAADSETTFQVNVVESLSVSITTPRGGASGSMGTFLRNTVNLAVTSNNANGFTASMYATNTNLTNSSVGNSETIPTMTTTSTRGNFGAGQINHWGFSLDDTASGSTSSTYSPIQTSSNPTKLLSATGVGSGSTAVYFGTQTNAAQAAGTYTGSVIIAVVSGTIDDDNPVVPDNPVTPDDTDDGKATYDSNKNSTVYSKTETTDDTTKTTTEVSEGDTTDAYPTDAYNNPKGVVEHTTASIAAGTSLATGLAVASAVAATSSIFFFILARRQKDDDEEDEEENL